MRNVKHAVLRRGGLAGPFCILALIALAAGCATAPPTEPSPPPSFALAVLDFQVPAEWKPKALPQASPQSPAPRTGGRSQWGDPMGSDRVQKDLEGWWFGSRGIWRNPGTGKVAADVFAYELNRLPFVKSGMISRSDVKTYMAEKRELIRQLRDQQRRELEDSPNPYDQEKAKLIAAMTEADYDRELEELPPRMIGQELKADRVLVGRIHDAYLAHNRTIHWYWSVLDIEVHVIDVDTGRLVWQKRARFKKSFASTTYLLEQAAREMVEAMKREYLYRR